MKLITPVLLIFGFVATAQAATILQTKGKSAILEVTDTELQTLKLQAGQNIQFSANGVVSQSSILKVIKNKILVKGNVDLNAEKGTPVSLAVIRGGTAPTGNAAASSAQRPVVRKEKSSAWSSKPSPSKRWITGVNLQYVTGSSKIQFADVVVGGITQTGASDTQSISGFNFSGTGIYYFDKIGVGGELEYGMLKGAGTNKSTITQTQLSGLAEYKITDKISAGGLLTIASNYKATDDASNDISLNGMGFGIFGTYEVMPQVRLIVDYRTISYKLEGNSVSESDIRLGGGYYF
jgi:hypothetical protein